MALGAVFPTYDIGADPVAIRDFAQAAEDLGYERLVAYDHVLGFEQSGRAEPGAAGVYDETVQFHEPLTLFAHLAAVTRRIRLQTGVVILPLREAALVAKQVAEVAILSAGRLELGVGLGSVPVEYEALGVDRAHRGARLEEQISLMRRLWSEPVVDFSGAFHRIDRGAMLPRPPSRVPVLIGGVSERAYERAIRIGDGFVLMASQASCHESARRLRDLLAASGRPPSEFRMHAMIDLGLGPDAIRVELEGWRAEGVGSVSVRAADRDAAIFGVPQLGLKSPAEHIAALERFAEIAA